MRDKHGAESERLSRDGVGTAVPHRPAYHFGRWWLAGCLVLASLFAGRAMLGSSSAPHSKAIVSIHSPASRNIEDIRVGQRVVTQDAAANASGKQTKTAVGPAIWRKLVLRADWRWKDGTLDDVNVETLVPTAWIKQHKVRIGAMVSLPLDLIEMGLPSDLQAKVLAIEPCPPIRSGSGCVVLTTVTT